MLLTIAILLVLGSMAWLGVAQRRPLGIWLTWTGFCLVLFPALLWWRDMWSLPNLLAAAAISPLAGALGLLDHLSLWNDD